jgi:glycosyltransferase involved in cell wall biosynthesis
MHVLFVHQNFPAQFGHIADYLGKHKGFRCSFVSEKPPGRVGVIERIQYKVQGGATRHNHYCSRTFENTLWHTHAVYQAMKARPDIRPDLVVGHSGFGSTLFLRDLYDCPIINYFEYFYRCTGSDMDFRKDFPSASEINRLRARARNAMLLLDMENCDVGYSPTNWQRSRLPKVFHEKIRTVFDGIDTNVWKPLPKRPRKLGDRSFPEEGHIVTYATRGHESMRGFDIFMKMSKKLADRRKDVIFLIAGEDRVCYGGDEQYTGKKSFKEWVLSQDNYDLSRYHFLGLLPPTQLAQLFSLTDLHIYLTVPFVLSWSLMDALACGTTILASNTAPVQEMIEHGKNGLLADFFDTEAMADMASHVLDHPEQYEHLGKVGTEMIRSRYSLDVCLPKMLQLYEDAQASYRSPDGPRDR